jgi:FAD/FMN-containing dehydrogenase
MPVNRRDLLKITSASGVALAGGSPAILRGPTRAAAASELTFSTSTESTGYAPVAVTPASSMETGGGTVIPPGDSRYSTLVRGFNLRWVGQPAYVALCHDTKQVVQAVQRAVDDGRRITVRGGGHCYEDFVSQNDDGVIIDLSPMNSVWRDPGTGWYGVAGGATLWDVYRRFHTEYGVTLPAGSCYSVGAGGHVTGGGYGLLSRLYGLTVDFLHAVEVIHVSASGRTEVITVSRDARDPAEQDLFWGHLGGGGGNFGIVTTFWFRDPPPAPEDAHLLTHAWDWSALDQPAFNRLVRNYGEFLAAHSAVDSPYKGLFSLLRLTQRVAGQVVLTAQYVGPESALLAEFARAIGDGLPQPTANRIAVGHHHAVADSTDVQQLPWLFATQTLNGSGPNRRGKYKSAHMLTAFPDHQIDTMWKHLTEPSHPNPQALLQVDSYGCRVNAVEPTATAIPQRSSTMKLQYQTYWTDPSDDAVNLAWIRAFYAAMYGERGPVPDDTVDGCYVNYPDADLENWSSLYYKDNYPRLQRVKGRWDPHNIFNHRQSIEPPDS